MPTFTNLRTNLFARDADGRPTDPDLRAIADATLAALQVGTEAVLARRARPGQIPTPARVAPFEDAVDRALERANPMSAP